MLHASCFVAAACNGGSYPLDVFPELHYQPSHRPLEPERLSPPEGAVPIRGAAPRLTFAQAEGLRSPLERTAESLAAAQEVYRVNCAACHGADGRGRGPLAAYYGRGAAAPVPPTDLAAERVRGRTDGQLWWLVRRGLGNMPAFGEVLDEREAWLAVLAIREVPGR